MTTSPAISHDSKRPGYPSHAAASAGIRRRRVKACSSLLATAKDDPRHRSENAGHGKRSKILRLQQWLHAAIVNVPPVEYEDNYYASLEYDKVAGVVQSQDWHE
jgi:hypothetical protein